MVLKLLSKLTLSFNSFHLMNFKFNRHSLLKILSAPALIIFILASCTSKNDETYANWQQYGGNKESNHYSSVTQIDTSNVSQLQVAWTYHTGDADSMTQIQVNPVIIDSLLYGLSPKLKLFALNAATGKEQWIFDPMRDTSEEAKRPGFFSLNVSRGVTYYTGGKNDKRIFFSANSQLYCVDALKGALVKSFGNNGKVDLHNDLGRDVSSLHVASTTPGIIYKDLIIIGTSVSEEAAAAPGFIRAYDVHTGKLRWIFHTIPQPGEFGYDTWDDKDAWKHIGGVNVWSGFSLDEKQGILFAPTGSASYDFYGGKRTGNNLFANCVLALDAATGKYIWHFQTVHHDVWDRDLPTAPVLVTITKDGKKIDALAQTTKSGFIFLLDRKTGLPVYPVNETPVPWQSELTGEKLSPTQPIPSFPKPFARQSLTEKDLNNLVPGSYEEIKKSLAGYHADNMFDPPSKEGTVIFPGFDGGAEWGGPAYDPSTNILYVNANEMPWVLTMVDVKNKAQKSETNLQAGRRLYNVNCMNCHGQQRNGGGNYPNISSINQKYNEAQFAQLVLSGRRRMPAFNQLSKAEIHALASFILDHKKEQTKRFVAPGIADDPWFHLPYTSTGYNKFLTKEGYPAVRPPWGTLNAINLNTGEYIWKDTIGDYAELKAKGIHSGTENYGGPVVTAGGIVFIAATSDAKIRAFNKQTGHLLWEAALPASGFATPSVYKVNGKEFIVIACGGGKLHKRSGDAYVAFALGEKK